MVSGIPELATAARADFIDAANEANFVTLVQQALYISSYPIYASIRWSKYIT